MKSFKEFRLNKAKALMLTIDWEYGDPNMNGADAWEAEGVFVHSWDKRKNKMTIAGTEKSLSRWLMLTYGLLKRSADQAMKDAKPLR